MMAVQALGCQSCGRAITPCLVCSHPIPAFRIADPSSQICRKCGVLNPLGEQRPSSFLSHQFFRFHYLSSFVKCFTFRGIFIFSHLALYVWNLFLWRCMTARALLFGVFKLKFTVISVVYLEFSTFLQG